MTIKAIITMTIVLVGIWGGLVLAMVKLQKSSGKEGEKE